MDHLKLLRALLRRRVDTEAERLGQALRKGGQPQELLESNLDQFAKSWKIYRDLDAETAKTWVWLAGLAAVCLFIVTLLSTTPRGRFFLVVDLETDALAATLERNWRSDTDIPVSRLSVKNLDRLEGPGLGLYLESPQRSAFFNASGRRLTLEHLDLTLLTSKSSDGSVLKHDGRLEMRLQPGQGTEIFLGHCAIFGRLRLDQNIQVQAGVSEAGPIPYLKNDNLAFPEPIEFWSNASGEVPVHLLVASPESWAAHDLRVRRIHFGREKLSDAGALSFESAVRSGLVYLPEIKREFKLRARDHLSLTVIETERLDIEVGKSLKVHFAGLAENGQLGPRGFEEQLAPSWLHYLYYQEPWKVFWSAVVFLWTLGWGLKTKLGR
jgi:hypothetical protein